jgi:mannosyltransferase OCH1-like enzyme
VIEKNIHRLWLGPKEMPEDYKRYGELWQELNPDWQVIEWTRETLPELQNQYVVDIVARTPRQAFTMDNDRAIAVQQADVIAYDLLNQFGGIYTNCDIEPFRPASEILELVGDKPWASYEDDRHVVNAIFGGKAGDSFWQGVNDHLPVRYFEFPDASMEWTTGPHLLTFCVNAWLEAGQEFTILPREAFNSTHFSSVPFGGDASAYREAAREAGAFGLHHWGHRADQGNYQ